ncbi:MULTISPECIES: hypothetical protein [Burkholderia]|uniref:hypothetical protein n=1 Tax=Burkholderia TaxID=32008 RepID=UPI0009B89F1C|nr:MULTISPECIES: hypothetical protein [Burkholderia]
MKFGDTVRSLAGGRKAQWYRNFAEHLRNVVLNVRIANNATARKKRDEAGEQTAADINPGRRTRNGLPKSRRRPVNIIHAICPPSLAATPDAGASLVLALAAVPHVST